MKVEIKKIELKDFYAREILNKNKYRSTKDPNVQGLIKKY
jgi:uncharacterized protein YqgQ